MNRLSAAVLLALAGCNSADPYLEIAGRQTAIWDEMGKVLESVTDAQSMEAAKDQFAELNARAKNLQHKVKGMAPPNAEVIEQLKEQQENLQRSVTRVQREIARVQRLPNGAAFLKDVEVIARGTR